jgi:hypothetical protein
MLKVVNSAGRGGSVEPKREIALLSTEAESSAISNLINHRSGL